MIKKRSLAIVIVLGFLISILFITMFSFAEERLTFTAYYPSPNAYYNRLNATDLSVTNHAHVGHSLGVGLHVANADSDISVIRTDETSSLAMLGQGDAGSNHAELVLASPGIVDPNDPDVWAMTHSFDQNKLIYRQHASGSGAGNFPAILTMDTQGNVGIGTTTPNTRLYLNDTRRDLLRLESNNQFGTGMMFRNTHANMGADQYFGIGWGGDHYGSFDMKDKFHFWYTADDINYDYPPPVMTIEGSKDLDTSGNNFKHKVGIRIYDPATTLDVGGGAIFALTDTQESFLVADGTHNPFPKPWTPAQQERGFVIWYLQGTGQLILGNVDATASPNVRIRNDLVADGGIGARNITLSRDLTARHGTFSGTVKANKLGKIGCYEKQIGHCDTHWRGEDTEWCNNGDYVAGLKMWTHSADDNEGYCFFLQCCRPGI